VVTIIAIHIVFFGGLLMQGCKRDNKKNDLTTTGESTNGALTLPVMTNRETLVDTNPAPPTNDISTAYQTAGSQSNTPALPSLVTQPEPFGGTTPTASTPGSEYTIVRNDTLSKIAHAHGTTAGAIVKANPGIDPAKLKIGQKIQIPASAAATAGTPSVMGDGTAPAVTAGAAATHVVKAGETLTKIARQHGTTVKAIRAANALKTDRVTVGQKLKIPAKSGATNASTTGNPVAVARNTRAH
jgi:LysM repeat protein